MTDRGGRADAAPTSAKESQTLSCPSAPAAPGVYLLGILGLDGRIHNVKTPMRVDQAFLESAADIGPVEARMRFAGRCQTSGCVQWTGSKCGVIDRAMAYLEAAGPPDALIALPPCTIRSTCRWFHQTGKDACTTCAVLVTDGRDQVAAE
ncbi:MAG: hypothetical protein ACK4MS_13020 [Paracoccaceae bacterium]